MREITIPPMLSLRLPTLTNQGGAQLKELPFVDFINDNIVADKKFLKEGRARDLKRAIKVVSLFEGKTDGYVLVEEGDWELMRDVCDQPTGGWNGFFGTQLMPYIDAIMEAKEIKVAAVPPEEKPAA